MKILIIALFYTLTLTISHAQNQNKDVNSVLKDIVGRNNKAEFKINIPEVGTLSPLCPKQLNFNVKKNVFVLKINDSSLDLSNYYWSYVSDKSRQSVSVNLDSRDFGFSVLEFSIYLEKAVFASLVIGDSLCTYSLK